jgi:hypothetical protein
MSLNKGVYDLNPTKAVMKQGSKLSRDLHAGVSPKAGEYTKQKTELEGIVHSADHPMMKTRSSNPAEHKHIDGRKHEDHHHAVKKLKGE